MIWVFSTNLLQLNTEDRFRGRVFSAEFAFMTLSMSLASSAAGLFIDNGVSADHVCIGSGIVMLFPGALWLVAQRMWRTQ